MSQQRISLFKLFNESNSLQIGGNPERQVREVRYDAETQEVRITYPGCFGWAVFKEQMCPVIDNGVIVVAEGYFTNDRQAGATVHLLFMHQNLDPSQHYLMRDRKSNCQVERIGPPEPPYVYRLEDSDGHRHLVRYEKTKSTGLWQRLSVARARLEDDNALRQLLQDTRNMAAEDGGGGYYDTEMIWMQKGHQIGSVDGPEIPPVPSQAAQGDAAGAGKSLEAQPTDIDKSYEEALGFLRGHVMACERDLAMAKHLVETFEAGDKTIKALEQYSSTAARAARGEIIKLIRENVETNLTLAVM